MAEDSLERATIGSSEPTGANTTLVCLHTLQCFEVSKLFTLRFVCIQDNNFTTALELAVRFGKTLIIQEADGVEPLLFPLLRGDLTSQGPRYVVQIGDKTIDYNEEFTLYLTTRNPAPEIPPDALSIITEVNFTTTRAGLQGQVRDVIAHSQG